MEISSEAENCEVKENRPECKDRIKVLGEKNEKTRRGFSIRGRGLIQ